jgi:hypothetical protein
LTHPFVLSSLYIKPINVSQTQHVFDVEDLEHLQVSAFQLSHYQFLQDSDTIYLLTAIGLTPRGNTVHIYTQTIHRTAQSTQNNT